MGLAVDVPEHVGGERLDRPAEVGGRLDDVGGELDEQLDVVALELLVLVHPDHAVDQPDALVEAEGVVALVEGQPVPGRRPLDRLDGERLDVLHELASVDPAGVVAGRDPDGPALGARVEPGGEVGSGPFSHLLDSPLVQNAASAGRRGVP